MPGEADIPATRSPRNRSHPLDRRIAELAAGQHGVVAVRQLTSLGLSSRAIRDRAAAGRFHRIHPGVYAVGHQRLSRRGWWMAAVLSGGPGTVLSHRPAGAEWNLRAWSGRPAITVPRWRRDLGGIEIRSARLPADEITVLDGIPITSVPRTILDLATILDAATLARVVEEAEHQEHRDTLSLPALLDRHRGERGVGRLRAVLDSVGYGMGVTKSMLEELFVRFVERNALPHPDLNASLHVDGRFFEVDCLWRRARVVVELHSAGFHSAAPAVTRDAGRDRCLLLAGYRVIHVTWAQLHDASERRALVADLRTLLRS